MIYRTPALSADSPARPYQAILPEANAGRDWRSFGDQAAYVLEYAGRPRRQYARWTNTGTVAGSLADYGFGHG